MEENEIKKSSLSYRPEIEYKDDYYSEESKDRDIKESSFELGDSIKDNILHNINKNEMMFEIIPEDISNVIKETYDIAKDIWIKELQEEKYTTIKYDNINIIEKEDTEETGDDDIKEDSFWEDDSEYDDEYEIYDEEIIVRQEYSKNMHDLLDYYFEKLADVASNYAVGYFLAFGKKGKDDVAKMKESILNAEKKIQVEKGNEHLIDVGFRTELFSDVKLSFMSRMCSVDQTMAMFGNFKTISELRKKYARMTYIESDSREDNMSDAMLSASKQLYSEKYDKSFIELFRYLKGSVELTDDILKERLASYKAKQTIAEKGGFKK